jgi:hypothetical protein
MRNVRVGRRVLRMSLERRIAVMASQNVWLAQLFMLLPGVFSIEYERFVRCVAPTV